MKKSFMLTTIEKVLHLKQVPLFKELSGEELLAIGNICSEKHFLPNEVIFKENTVPYEMFIIVTGRVEISCQENNIKHTLTTLKQFDYFGEMALLDDNPRSATATALEKTICLSLNREAFIDLITEYTNISLNIIKHLCRLIREANIKIIS